MPVFTFGDTRFIDPTISGIALVTTVVFLALCDYATHCLEELIHHSATYMTMLQKIYKELMIMGLVSFCLVMYEAAQANISDKVHLWIVIFDFVGYVLFFHAIFTVIHAISIIFWSMLTSREYNRFHSISIADASLGIEMLKQNRIYRFFYELNYYPFLTTRHLAEFKVIHVLFRNTFGVPLDFNFGEYLGKCFERYSLNIIKLSVTSWIMMFILFAANLIRIYSPYTHSFRCEDSSSHGDDGGSGGEEPHRSLNLSFMLESSRRRNSAEGDDHGETSSGFRSSDCDYSYVRMFVICSLFLECYVVIVFLVGRLYTLRLLRKAGVNEISRTEDDLVYFLDEEAAQQHIALHKQQTAAETTVAKTRNRKMSIQTFSKFIEKAKTVKSKKTHDISRESHKEDEDPSPTSHAKPSPAHALQRNHVSKFHLVSNYQPTTGSLLSQKENIFSITRKLQAQKKNRKFSIEFGNIRRQHSGELKLAEDFSDIYFLHSPTLYFRAVEIGIVLNSIYLSLWVSDFIHIAQNLHKWNESYQLIMAIPFILLIPLLTQTVKTASLLAAIAALEVDVISEVLEESEERTYLIQDLRSKIIQRTAGHGLQQRELLESVFKEIDTDGSGEINRSEFKSLLAKMDMGYSGKKFTRLYSAIDRNGDGSLSLAELNHLLFPQDAILKEVEELGLKVQSRLDRRITALEKEQHSESDNVPLKVHNKRIGQISSLKSLSEATWKQTGVSQNISNPQTQIKPDDDDGRLHSLPSPVNSPSVTRNDHENVASSNSHPSTVEDTNEQTPKEIENYPPPSSSSFSGQRENQPIAPLNIEKSNLNIINMDLNKSQSFPPTYHPHHYHHQHHHHHHTTPPLHPSKLSSVSSDEGDKRHHPRQEKLFKNVESHEHFSGSHHHMHDPRNQPATPSPKYIAQQLSPLDASNGHEGHFFSRDPHDIHSNHSKYRLTPLTRGPSLPQNEPPLMERVRRHLKETGHLHSRIEPCSDATNESSEQERKSTLI